MSVMNEAPQFVSVIDEELVTLTEILKAIWCNDPWLSAQIPATDDDANLFFEDGLGYITRPEDIPPTFASLTDEGTVLKTKASERIELVASSVTIRIGTPSKPLTRQLSSVYSGHIERLLRGQTCNLGRIIAYTFDRRIEQKTASGFRLWTGQLTATISGRKPWQLPLPAPAL